MLSKISHEWKFYNETHYFVQKKYTNIQNCHNESPCMIKAYIVWAITPLYPHPFSLSPISPSLPGRICSALISNFVEGKT
jgi:hypothetical protein